MKGREKKNDWLKCRPLSKEQKQIWRFSVGRAFHCRTIAAVQQTWTSFNTRTVLMLYSCHFWYELNLGSFLQMQGQFVLPFFSLNFLDFLLFLIEFFFLKLVFTSFVNILICWCLQFHRDWDISHFNESNRKPTTCHLANIQTFLVAAAAFESEWDIYM